MTKYIRLSLAVILLVFCASVIAYATDGDIYGDAYTTESSSGHWTFTSFETGKQLANVTVVSNTPASLTTAASGKTYIVDGGTAGPAGATIVTMVLPNAADQLIYTFTTGDGSQIVVQTGDGATATNDIIMFGDTPAVNKSLRSSSVGTTGTTITVVGSSSGNGFWYVLNATGGYNSVVDSTDLWKSETKM